MEQRPLGVMIEDFQNSLSNIINDSGLPAYLIEMIICNILPEVSNIGKQQMAEERQKFQAQEETEDVNE